MSQHTYVVQHFHREHYICTLDLLSTRRRWFYRCTQNIQDWLSTSRLTTGIMDQGFEAFMPFWIHWLYTEKIGLHTCRGCHSGCLDIDCAFGGIFCCTTQHYSLNRLPDTQKYWKKQPRFWFLAWSKFLHGKKGTYSGILVLEWLPRYWGLQNLRKATLI